MGASNRPEVGPEFLPTRRSLVSRLKNWEDHESWRAFFDTYWRLIYSVARKAGLRDAAAQDVVQETIVSVAKSIRKFTYDGSTKGSFKGWLMQITRRRIADHLRRKEIPLEPHDDSEETPLIDKVPNAECAWAAVWDEEWQKNITAVALDRVKLKVKPKQYQLFDSFVLKEWPMEKVRRKFGVNLGQVYFAKYKISALLQRELRALELETEKGARS